MKEGLTNEVIGCFKFHERLTERELEARTKKQKKVGKALSMLPIVLFWQHPLRWLHRQYLATRNSRLKKEISRLSRRIKRFIEAKNELKKENYGPAISLLGDLLDKMSAIIQEGNDPDGTSTHTHMPNPIFYDIVNLRNQLIKLHQEQATGKNRKHE